MIAITCRLTCITSEKFSSIVPCRMQFFVVPTIIIEPFPVVSVRMAPYWSGNYKQVNNTEELVRKNRKVIEIIDRKVEERS